MGEVGTNSADNPHADLKMNGGINGNCDDEIEAMDVDAPNTSNEPKIVTKNADSSDAPTSTTTTADENAMKQDNSGKSDDVKITSSELNASETDTQTESKTKNENKHEQDVSTESISKHENGATEKSKETCDQKQIEDEQSDELIETNTIVCDDKTKKDVDESDATVKVLNDPLSMDTDEIDVDEGKKTKNRTNQSRPQSTENGTSATVTSSNDKGKH